MISVSKVGGRLLSMRLWHKDLIRVLPRQQSIFDDVNAVVTSITRYTRD